MIIDRGKPRLIIISKGEHSYYHPLRNVLFILSSAKSVQNWFQNARFNLRKKTFD